MLIVRIRNDGTGPDEASNYNYEVYVNNFKIDEGRIESHDRRKEWMSLVSRVATDGFIRRTSVSRRD